MFLVKERTAKIAALVTLIYNIPALLMVLYVWGISLPVILGIVTPTLDPGCDIPGVNCLLSATGTELLGYAVQMSFWVVPFIAAVGMYRVIARTTFSWFWGLLWSICFVVLPVLVLWLFVSELASKPWELIDLYFLGYFILLIPGLIVTRYTWMTKHVS